jgi:hypothetical protein
MKEAEWLKSEFLYGIVSIPKCRDNRKRRLLFCAIARRSLKVLPEPDEFEQGIEFCEKWADGEFDRAKWTKLRRTLRKAQNSLDEQPARCSAEAVIAVTEKEYMSFKMAHEFSRNAFATQDRSNWDRLCNTEEKAHLEMARDIFGNPFQPVTLESEVMAWKSGAVNQVADSIYEENRFNELPVLGDALEEAGCTSKEVLKHCRSKRSHVKGCWVVDLVRQSAASTGTKTN